MKAQLSKSELKGELDLHSFCYQRSPLKYDLVWPVLDLTFTGILLHANVGSCRYFQFSSPTYPANKCRDSWKWIRTLRPAGIGTCVPIYTYSVLSIRLNRERDPVRGGFSHHWRAHTQGPKTAMSNALLLIGDPDIRGLGPWFDPSRSNQGPGRTHQP